MHPTVPATARDELLWACIEARGWDDASWETVKGLQEKFGVKIKYTSCNRKIATLRPTERCSLENGITQFETRH